MSRAVLEDVAGGAVEDAADGVQRTDADGADLPGLEDGHIGHGDPHLVRKLAQGHLPFGEHDIQIDNDHTLHHEFLVLLHVAAQGEDLRE